MKQHLSSPLSADTRLRIAAIVMLFLLLPATMQAQQLQLRTGGKSDAATQVAVLQQLQRKAPTEPIRMLAKVNDAFDAARLRPHGIVIGSRTGNIVTLRLTADKVQVLDGDNGIVAYSLARKIQPTLDRARRDTRTDSVHQGLTLPQAYTGEGVIIGVTDWGFDYTHPNYNNNGADNRRILRAWDQFKLSGPAPDGFDYGTEHVGRAALIHAQCDTFGLYGYGTHGTHVTGIAAGRGIEGRFTGQAPYANILMASFYLNEAAWLDAANWMYKVAKEEGKRLVINCSWGMYTLGPIDGTSMASQAINSLADSGVVICTSAGNNGDDKFHISRTFTPGTPDTLASVAEYYGSTEIGSGLVMWGEEGKAFQASVAFGNDSTPTEGPWYSTADGSRYIEDFVVIDDDTVWYDVTVEGGSAAGTRPGILLNVHKNANYHTHLRITANEGTVHAWNLCNLENGAGNMGAAFTRKYSVKYVAGNDAYGIGEPACAEGCIAVAAHNSETYKPDGTPEPGYLASFSSHGPVIDGRRKPDISAPGGGVISSINYFCPTWYNANLTYTYASRNYIWSGMSGTSMSSPSVAGIAALILQANPALTPLQVKEIIKSTARNDSLTGPLVERDSISDLWGMGRINALAAVNEALARVDIQEASQEWFAKSLQVYPNPAAERVHVLTGRHTPEEVTLYSVDGRIIAQKRAVMETWFDLTGLPQGVYLVKCGPRVTKLTVN